ncbi:hypothetical protein BGX34_004694 [Mortierella sp. NVP85]|nr:hypothetical protein BGX34_004694 [Mortierella sp. NVP85]
MAEILQAIYVRDYETRTQPKPHIVYRVEVHAAVRTWSVWKRYSEFEHLNERFEELFPGQPPPQGLPGKHWWQSTMDNPELLEERRAGLELYLRAILSHQDDKWRLTREWNEFLAVPIGRSQTDLLASKRASTVSTSSGRNSPSLFSHFNIFGFGGNQAAPAEDSTGTSPAAASPMMNPGPAPQTFTTESWLEEYRTLQGVAREVRTLINKRDTHLNRSEISASHNSTIQSKKLLTSLGLRIPALESGLTTLAMGAGGGRKGSVMSDGELRRRQDMLAELKDEREVLTKLVLANRQNEGVVGYQGAGSSAPASAGDRNSLLVAKNSRPLSNRSSGDEHTLVEAYHAESGSQPAGGFSRMPNPRRVFGRVVQTVTESSETRGLDNEGLLILQQQQMQQQDDHIEQFSAILQRQKHIGLAIGQELDDQIHMLDELDRDVDRTALKLSLVNKKIGKIN